MRHKIFRTIAVSRNAATEQVLLSALRVFHVTKQHPSLFYITDMYSPDGLPLSGPNLLQNLTRKEGKRRGVFLRYK